MTEDDIKALIRSTLVDEVETLLKPTVESMTATLNRFVVDTNDSFEARFTALEAPKTNPATKDTKQTSESALDARIRGLEQQLADTEAKRQAQELQAQQLRFDNSLSTELDGIPNLLQKPLVKELLANRLKAGVTEKDNSWLTKDGKTLTEAVKEFMSSDSGLHFQAADHRDGAGTSEPKTEKTTEKADFSAAMRSWAMAPRTDNF